jgi:hypothetical protein
MKRFQLPLLLLVLPLTFLYATWHELASVPEEIYEGEGIVYGGGYVWAIAGEAGGDGFYAYDISQSSQGDEWITLDNFPDEIDEIGAITYETGYERRIFVVDDDELYFYTKLYKTGYEGSWDKPILLPEDYEFGPGTCIAFQYAPAGAYTGYLYLLRGGGGTIHNFFRRAIDVPVENPGGSPQRQFDWEELPPLQSGIVAGGAMCYNKHEESEMIYAFPGEGSYYFYGYDMNSDAWRQLEATPLPQNNGSSITDGHPHGSYLSAIFGENNSTWWYYDVVDDDWDDWYDDLPADLGAGATITRSASNGNFWLVIGGESDRFFTHSGDDDEAKEGSESQQTMAISQKARISSYSDRLVIHYSTDIATSVRIQVYDLSGKLVKTLFNGKTEKGEHQVSWNKTDRFGQNVASGVYFIAIDKGKNIERFKTVISK